METVEVKTAFIAVSPFRKSLFSREQEQYNSGSKRSVLVRNVPSLTGTLVAAVYLLFLSVHLPNHVSLWCSC